MRKNLIVIGSIFLLLSISTVPFVLANNDHNVPPNTKTHGKSNVGHVLLVSKDEGWNPIWPGAFGQLKYPIVSASEDFDARLIVHHLEPSSWYLVTLQGPDDGSVTDELLGSVGYYGVEEKPYWADVALFQTNAGGNANVVIPRDFPNKVADPGYGELDAPILPNGEYSGVRIVVKYINTGEMPDWNVLVTGGEACLYEYDSFAFTIG